MKYRRIYDVQKEKEDSIRSLSWYEKVRYLETTFIINANDTLKIST